MPILVEADPTVADATRFAVSSNAVVVATEMALMHALDAAGDETLVVFGPDVDAQFAFAVAAAQRAQRPALGVVLIRKRVDAAILNQALRAGVREVVKADDLEALSEACARSQEVSQQVTAAAEGETRLADGPAGTVITVFSAKGGCGKTTIATNVASVLASRGQRRVCLVDLDLAFGDVAITLQLFPERTLADTIPMAGHIDELGIRSIVTHHAASGMDTLLAPLEPRDAERIPPSIVTDLMHQLKLMYDVVVVDTPPSFTDHVLAALDATDSFLLVATLDIPALKNLKLTVEMLEMLGYPSERQHLVLNRADAKVGLTVADARQALHRPVECEIPSSRDVPRSTNNGQPLVLAEPHHPVSAAIEAFALGQVAGQRTPEAASVMVPKSRHARRVSLLRRSEVGT